MAIAVFLASSLVYIAVRNELRAQVDRSLLSRALSVRELAGNTYRCAVPAPRFGAAAGHTQYVTADGKVVCASRGEPTFPVSRRALRVAADGDETSFESAMVSETHVRVVTIPMWPGVALQVGRPLDEVDAILGRLGWVLALVGVAGIALAGSLGAAVARVALRPVDRLTRAAEQVAETRDPKRTIDDSGTDELARLASSFNTMLGALDDSLRAQRQLVADASHELRTPLTALRTNIEVLRRAARLPADERERILADIVTQIDDLTTLVGDLVDLARGDEPTQMEQVALDEIVAHEAERARANHPGVTFAADLQPSVVRGVPPRIARAVSNLLDNAGKWSGPGGVVDVSVAERTIVVRDRGPGIAREDLPYIFDRFYRAPAARSLPGSGLGLAIVRQTMQAHGGSVSVQNAPDGGAVFTLRFPDPRSLGVPEAIERTEGLEERSEGGPVGA